MAQFPNGKNEEIRRAVRCDRKISLFVPSHLYMVLSWHMPFPVTIVVAGKPFFMIDVCKDYTPYA